MKELTEYQKRVLNRNGVYFGEDMPLKFLIERMEEMANAPKEEDGKRSPGERGMYER